MSGSVAAIVTVLRPVPFPKCASSNYTMVRTNHTHTRPALSVYLTVCIQLCAFNCVSDWAYSTGTKNQYFSYIIVTGHTCLGYSTRHIWLGVFDWSYLTGSILLGIFNWAYSIGTNTWYFSQSHYWVRSRQLYSAALQRYQFTSTMTQYPTQ